MQAALPQTERACRGMQTPHDGGRLSQNGQQVSVRETRGPGLGVGKILSAWPYRHRRGGVPQRVWQVQGDKVLSSNAMPHVARGDVLVFRPCPPQPRAGTRQAARRRATRMESVANAGNDFLPAESQAPRLKRLAVFCGASYGTQDAYSTGMRALGQEMVRRGTGLVYGGRWPHPAGSTPRYKEEDNSSQ